MTRSLAFALMLVFGGACGGSGGMHAMSWDDDGTHVQPPGAMAAFNSAAGTDSYDINGLGADPGDVTVQVTAPSPIAPQTFVCGQPTAGQKVLVSYSPSAGGAELVDQSCTVVLTQTGQIGGTVVGTFEAVISLQAGGTKTISNGTFNLSVARPL
jgi:hypothetical protein